MYSSQLSNFEIFFLSEWFIFQRQKTCNHLGNTFPFSPKGRKETNLFIAYVVSFKLVILLFVTPAPSGLLDSNKKIKENVYFGF